MLIMGCLGSKPDTYVIERYPAEEASAAVDAKSDNGSVGGTPKGKRNSKSVIPKNEEETDKEESDSKSPDGKKAKKAKKEKEKEKTPNMKSLTQKKVCMCQ